jgi:WhiB family transcriptional regulator, redox-sensing transcriptional regulator
VGVEARDLTDLDHQQGHQEDIVRLTTLLDTDRTGSGPWPAAASTTTTDERQRFDRLVADFIPCRSGDPELWFAEQTSQVERAKALCRECPLIEGCLAGAIERAEPWGVWGGEVFIGGEVVATKRGRGRPRKNAVV